MAKQQYEIAIPAFSGPLDLLLHLIERSELDVTALSLANVTDQYLKQVEALDEGQIAQKIDFIVVGARLMVIKSRALLPTPPVVLAGEEEEEDPAEALVRQLKQYQRFKQIAEFLSERQEANLHTYLRVVPPRKVETKLDVSNVPLTRIQQRMAAVLVRYADRKDSVSVAAPRQITVEGQIKKLRDSVRRRKRIQFNDLLSEQSSRVELSVSLLALLEMVKRRVVTVEQAESFGPILINKFEEKPDS
ncbi:MAG: segregation and condensation protein A [Candidatus Promineifilaceae bacterium]